MLPAKIQQKRALVVDDNATSREMLHAALTSFAFQVTSVDSGIAGLLELEARREAGTPFDLLLLDWQMPGLSGAQTLRCLKAIEPPCHPPTLLLAPPMEQVNIRQQMGGFQPEVYLDKPVQLSLLFDTIMMLFGQGSGMTLPRDTETAEAPMRRAVAGSRVLLVEDNEINQQVAQELLAMLGFEVCVAGHGGEACQRLEEGTFDVVLMDIQMPVMDGYQATAHIRAQAQHATLPIIAMTANVMAQDLMRCREVGMVDHIGKPIDPNILSNTLQKWVRFQDHEAAPQETPSAPVEPPPPPLPVVPGLDTQAGLIRVNGNRALFRSLLGKFVTTQSQGVAEIQAAMDGGDEAQVRHLAHTLKGVAGTIGATRVQTLAAELEERLAFPEGFASEMALVLHSIQDFLSAAAAEKSAPQPDSMQAVDPALLLQTLEALTPHLEKKRPGPCRPLLKSLASMACPVEGVSQKISRLTTLIKSYQFKKARAIHQEIMLQLQQKG